MITRTSQPAKLARCFISEMKEFASFHEMPRSATSAARSMLPIRATRPDRMLGS